MLSCLIQQRDKNFLQYNSEILVGHRTHGIFVELHNGNRSQHQFLKKGFLESFTYKIRITWWRHINNSLFEFSDRYSLVVKLFNTYIPKENVEYYCQSYMH